MPKLTNPDKRVAVNAMYGGVVYTIPAGGSITVESHEAAAKLHADLAPLGVTLTPDKPAKAKE